MDERRRQESTEAPQRSRPWGFWLVLAAIVVIAVVYSVTMFTIDIKTPTTAIAAMTATFTVIGTLVGTYFGIKAGLDGQDKVRQTADRRAGRSDEERQWERIQREEDSRIRSRS